jgi:hypothetical protein
MSLFQESRDTTRDYTCKKGLDVVYSLHNVYTTTRAVWYPFWKGRLHIHDVIQKTSTKKYSFVVQTYVNRFKDIQH